MLRSLEGDQDAKSYSRLVIYQALSLSSTYIFFRGSKILNLQGGVFGVRWSAFHENQIDILE